MTLIIHIHFKGRWEQLEFTGPSPNFNSDEFNFMALDCFPRLNQVHLWLTPKHPEKITLENLPFRVL